MGDNVHYRLKRDRGKASAFVCIDGCGRQARDWSWTHDTDRLDVNNYEPRCRSCHMRYDMTDERRHQMSLDQFGTIRPGNGSKPCEPDCACGKHDSWSRRA